MTFAPAARLTPDRSDAEAGRAGSYNRSRWQATLELDAQYRALREEAGLLDRSDRGPDRRPRQPRRRSSCRAS